jgi:hypothetical protein
LRQFELGILPVFGKTIHIANQRHKQRCDQRLDKARAVVVAVVVVMVVVVVEMEEEAGLITWEPCTGTAVTATAEA